MLRLARLDSRLGLVCDDEGEVTHKMVAINWLGRDAEMCSHISVCVCDREQQIGPGVMHSGKARQRQTERER